jgi:hypothetical protein
MTNSTKTTKISAAFLAAVLVAGTLALSSPSFMVGAQAAPSYGMEKKYDSYESDYGSDYGKDSYDKRSYEKDSYGQDSYDKKPSYEKDSYGQDSYDKKPSYGNDDYGMDSYDKKPSYGNDDYGMDSYDKKPSYGNDDYGKDSYDKTSYGKDDRKKSSDSVSIKKIKCNNINLNLNSVNASIGAPPVTGDNGGNGVVAGEALAAESIAANGIGNGNGNGNGNGDRSFIDRENDFAFVCINNNNNVGANATDGNGDVEEGCEECFDQLDGRVAAFLDAALLEGFEVDGLTVPAGTSIAELCVLLEGADISLTLSEVLEFIAEVFTDPTQAEIDQIFELLLCLEALGVIDLEIDLPVLPVA